MNHNQRLSQQSACRQISVQRTPLPIETAFTQQDIAYNITYAEDEDGVQQQIRVPIQDNHINRYYFDYPPEWKTSDTGEAIVGVRSISLINSYPVISFDLHIRKYTKSEFLRRLKLLYPDRYGRIDDIQLLINLPEDEQPNQDEIEDVVQGIGGRLMNTTTIHIYVSVDDEDSMYDIIEAIGKQIKHAIDSLKAPELGVKFVQDEENVINGYPDMDVFIDYDEDDVDNPIVISSFRNEYTVENDTDDCFVDCMLTKSDLRNVTLSKYYDPNTFKMKEIEESDEEEDTTLYNEDDDMFDEDFVNTFNIGSRDCNEDIENPYTRFLFFSREHSFFNVWNRIPCNVHASFANQSNRNYLGRSNVVFNPIKYYRLNAYDNRFWIEFYDTYSGEPIRLPKDESFVMEMQFMQNDKLLYV